MQRVRTARERCCVFLNVAICCSGSGPNMQTNLQIPVDDPINMAVVDTLEDLLYAVAEDRRVMNKDRIVMKQMEGVTEKQGRKAEKTIWGIIEGKKRENNPITMYHMYLKLDFL